MHIISHKALVLFAAEHSDAAGPAVIESEQEYERLFREFDSLWKRQPELLPEEDKLLSLLVLLIEDYEERHHGLHASTPHSRLGHLMEARDLAQKDIWRLLGSRGVASEVIRGKRVISKSQAKKLAEFFHVTPDLFL